tara:strand:- start:63 stop:833 length:771 start_codon:yes stop_codon:yes gene_type:complete
MKNLILTTILLFTATINAQYAIISAVDLNEGTENDYLQTEKFWGPLHKKAIEDGVQTQQAVWKVIQTNDQRDNPADYFIITGFSSKEQLANYSSADYGAYAQEVYKGKMSRRAITRMFEASNNSSNERRNYHIEAVSRTILAGGDLEPGDRMSITSTIAKSDDFESWESEIIKPMVEKEILMGQHRYWGLAKVYERTDNAYKNATHFFFNIGVPDVPRTGWESMGDTFEGTKLREGVQSASDHQNFVTLELVSIHN